MCCCADKKGESGSHLEVPRIVQEYPAADGVMRPEPRDTAFSGLTPRDHGGKENSYMEDRTLQGDPSAKKGVILYNDGSKYEGEWKQGRAAGKGRCEVSNGTVLEGEFADDLPHGHAKETRADGSIFEGSFENGKKTGKGRWQSVEEGWTYTGDFKDDYYEGFGQYEWSDGRVYTGEWKQNQFDGYGRMVWADGRMYEGAYREDKKNGVGLFRWADGRFHLGIWKDGMQDGKGIFTTKDAMCRAGEWKKGAREKWTSKPTTLDDFASLVTPDLLLRPPAGFPTGSSATAAQLKMCFA